jgi:hypothetical protein
MATGANMGNRMTGAMGQGMMGMQKDKIPKGYQKGQLAQFTPEQMQLFQSLFGQLGPESFLGKLAGGDQSQFEQLEAPALRQFGELQGGIASRFSGMGSGARKSSGFQNTMSGAAGDFAQQLQSQRLGLQRNALQDLMGMSNQLLQQRPYENFVTQKPLSFWQQLMTSLGGAVPQAAALVGTQYMAGNQNDKLIKALMAAGGGS